MSDNLRKWKMKKAAQLVFVPNPGVGHLMSTLQFAKLLIDHHQGLWINVLLINLPFHDETAPDTQSLTSERLRLINLPEIPSDSETTMITLLENHKPHVKQTVSDLTASDSAPPLAAFVVDMFCTTMIDVAKEFGVPSLVFFTSSVAILGLMLHLHTLREEDNNMEFGESKEFSVPSFANVLPSKVLPYIAQSKEYDSFFMSYGEGLKRADGIIVNSFEELESHAVRSFSHSPQPIYPVGPILNPNIKAKDSDLETEILTWLDDQPPSSVVFLCFGSMGSFHEDQVREIALALENTGTRFLWSLRKPSPNGTRTMPSDYAVSDLAAILPLGFLERTAGIGKVVGWAPQTQILAHEATAGFVSHCGWNSTLESIYFGVPIAAWPLYAEQQTNAFELVCELKMGVEVALDYRFESMDAPNFLLSAARIERGIRSLLHIDPEIRNKVKEMSEKSRNTLLEGGRSYFYLQRLIDYVMNRV